MSENNKALVCRLLEECVNQGNFSSVDQHVGADYVYREPTVGERRGRSAFRELIAMYRNAIPDVKITVEQQVAEGDHVLTRWVATGTHRGELFGAAGTGKSLRVEGMLLSRVVNGKLVENVEIYDTLGMLQQLGIVTAALAKAA